MDMTEAELRRLDRAASRYRGLRSRTENLNRHLDNVAPIDYAAIVKRYEDAGDTANADVIRKQWKVAQAASGITHSPGRRAGCGKPMGEANAPGCRFAGLA